MNRGQTIGPGSYSLLAINGCDAGTDKVFLREGMVNLTIQDGQKARTLTAHISTVGTNDGVEIGWGTLDASATGLPGHKKVTIRRPFGPEGYGYGSCTVEIKG